ncbi:hypothetical protein KQI65_03825 [bacterium]|nr:hypothetical protein [bacterium]
MKLVSLFSVLLVGAFIFTTGCSDDEDTNGPTTTNPTITISGTLDIRNGATIPEDAKLSIIWSVDAAGDYVYLFGNGEIDRATGTFSITLPDAPPATALNSSMDGRPAFGIGNIVLAAFPSTEPHILTAGEMSAAYGAVNNIGVTFIDGDPAGWGTHQELSWLTAFQSGYDIGEGKETSGMHDIFVPAAASTFVLTVSTNPGDFHFPNWK